MATVSTPGLCRAGLDLEQALAAAEDAPAEEVAALAPDELAADELPADDELVEVELPQAAMTIAATAERQPADTRRALVKAHNLHGACGARPGPA